MSSTTFWLIVLLILAAVAVFAIWRYRNSSSVDITTPMGGIKVAGKNQAPAVTPPPAPGIKGKNITAKQGSVTAIDDTGGGVDVEDITAGQDVDLYTGNPQDPKAPPPT